jgi:hypothetical protein
MKNCDFKVGHIVVPIVKTEENKHHQYVVTRLIDQDTVEVCVHMRQRKIFKYSELKKLYPDQ